MYGNNARQGKVIYIFPLPLFFAVHKIDNIADIHMGMTRFGLMSRKIRFTYGKP
jgi:hypothetical protein